MNYLLINHVPFGKGSASNRFVVGDMWLEDLRMQAKAWSSHGRLSVAVPCVEQLPVELSGSFNLVEFSLDEENFDLFPLPYYCSWKAFIRVLPELKRQLDQACRWASIVQADYGGHPVSPGQVAWSIADKHHTKRIWLFDGADPFPRMEQYVAEEPNLVKRFIKNTIVKRFEQFCTQAISSADLVFTHNASVAARFKDVWDHGSCHSFNRSYVKQEHLIDSQQTQERKQRLMDASQPLRLVVAGRQISIKATDHVLQAMATAVQQGANLELDVIGDGESLPDYKRMAIDLGIADRVRFLGTVAYGQPLFDLFRQAHVMVITNLTAEISRNVLLSMAFGLPLILYRNPGSDPMIESNDAGILVPSGDISALSDALFQAAHDRTRLTELVTNGLNLAQTQTLENTHIHRADLASSCLRNAEFVVGPADPSRATAASSRNSIMLNLDELSGRVAPAISMCKALVERR